jgi:hypothetical protein
MKIPSKYDYEQLDRGAPLPSNYGSDAIVMILSLHYDLTRAIANELYSITEIYRSVANVRRNMEGGDVMKNPIDLYFNVQMEDGIYKICKVEGETWRRKMLDKYTTDFESEWEQIEELKEMRFYEWK